MDFVTPFITEDFKKTPMGRFLESINPEARILIGALILGMVGGAADAGIGKFENTGKFTALVTATIQTAVLQGAIRGQMEDLGPEAFLKPPNPRLEPLALVASVSGLALGYGLTEMAINLSTHKMPHTVIAGGIGVLWAGARYWQAARQAHLSTS